MNLMAKLEKLLFVTKFEELCYDALQTMLNLRTAGLNHIVFMNVIERERVAMRRGKGYDKAEERRLREAANIRFIDWAENLFEQGLEVGVYIVVGSVTAEVIKAAEAEAADLIVIGRPQSPGVLEMLYSGSDITELLRRTSIPVLVYKAMSEHPMALGQPFTRPLLAVDWSPASLKAVPYLKLLKNVAEEVNVIHVADEKSLTGPNAMAIQKTRKETRQKLNLICAELEKEGVPARSRVYIGDPDVEIEKAARECQATMVVLGSSATAAWRERWLGSTPRKMAEKSAFPTLIIPPEKQ
jgi:nucleotide-binding universal stress UspA family protein